MCVFDFVLDLRSKHVYCRLDDVEAKLAETEREADKARKDSKTARDEFNDIKKQR